MPAWENRFKQFRELKGIWVSNRANKNRPLLDELELFIKTVYQEGLRVGEGKPIPLSVEPSENEVWWIVQEVPGLHRKGSAFITDVLSTFASLKEGSVCYISHRRWLEEMEREGRELSEAYKKYGPRQTLKRHGIDCVSVTLFGDSLKKWNERHAEKDGVVLTEEDVIYKLTKKAK